MKNLIILLAFLLISSCQNQSEQQDVSLGKGLSSSEAISDENRVESEPPRSAEPPAPPASNLEKGSKLIKNGNIHFEVTNLEIAKTKVDTLIKSVSGYYENEVYESQGNRIVYSLTIRIPSISFAKTIKSLENGIGKLQTKSINTQDVTAEYVDTKIRLENNLAYLQQYQTILQKAKSIKEILDIKEKIRPIEEEIESRKGQLKYFDDQVNYSTLNIELSALTSTDLSNSPNFGTRIFNAFNNGIQGFITFIIGIVNLWPFVILIIILYLARRPISNLLRRSNKSKDV